MVRSKGLATVGVSLLALAAVLAPVALAGATASSRRAGEVTPHVSLANSRPRTAHAANTLDITDTAKLHYTGGSGSLLHESGATSGTLPGSMTAACNIGAMLSTNFTIYAADGTIRGHGTASPHSAGIYESFAGTIVATGGTGRYAHAHGRAGLYGVFDHKNYALTVQTTGKLSF
ncbi:MAG TPA: hypothetical protein VGL54_06350 [Solirubrobacteraceae bacterium]